MDKKKWLPQIQKGTRVLVFGVGLHGGGKSVILYLRKKKASIRVTDLRPRRLIAKKMDVSNIKGTFGKHSEKDFTWAELIIKNPAIPSDNKFLKKAEKRNVPILSDLSIFFDEICKQPDIMITGTRGKSTTTMLITKALSRQYTTNTTGNICIPPLTTFPQKKSTLQISEISSFQIDDLDKHISPHVAVFTNIFEDHLNRYKSKIGYINSKLALFKRQSKNDFAVLNADDKILMKSCVKIPAQKYFFSLRALPRRFKGAYLEQNTIFWQNNSKKLPIGLLNKIHLLGSHNLSNILAMIVVAKLFKVSNQNIIKTITAFKGLPGRLELIAKKKNIHIFNDTTSTMPDALLAAYEALRSQYPNATLHFIIGGADKKLDFSLLKKITDKHIFFYGLKGSATSKMKKYLPTFPLFDSLTQAVSAAKKNTLSGDVLVLSPGAASFNMFQNEFDRGDQFIQLIQKWR